MKWKYKSDAFRAINESAAAKFEIGAISQARMREFDEACLVKPDVPIARVPTRKPAAVARSGTPVYARGK
ncbi:MAG: hypothetical protein Pg6A_18270 [Termitinemataceae bacterium]|nr:MAG: hypothetical protein Pg6A_18270 [Termitinemataceae bacterium]